jgi:hypothetical protein
VQATALCPTCSDGVECRTETSGCSACTRRCRCPAAKRGAQPPAAAGRARAASLRAQGGVGGHRMRRRHWEEGGGYAGVETM